MVLGKLCVLTGMAIHGVRRYLVLAPGRVTWTLRPSTLRLLCNCVNLDFTSLSKSFLSFRKVYLLLHQVENFVGFLIWLKDFERFRGFEVQIVTFPLRFLFQLGVNFDACLKSYDLWISGHSRQVGRAGRREGWVKTARFQLRQQLFTDNRLEVLPL